MRLPAAYIIVVLAWSTTPLAMKWSTATGFFAALSLRVVLASIIALLLTLLLRRRFPVHRRALRLYVFGGLTLTMTQVQFYWAAQYIPSGWIAVIFGLAPIITGITATCIPGAARLTVTKAGALLLSVTGLALIALQGRTMGPQALPGVGVACLATLTYAVALVWLKRIHADVDPFATMAGSHYVSLLLCSAGWLWSGVPELAGIPGRAALSIVYLAIVGSVLAATLFFYLLRHLDTTRIAMINLVTPVLAVLAGHMLNREPFNFAVAAGTTLVVLGLMSFEFERSRPPRTSTTQS